MPDGPTATSVTATLEEAHRHSFYSLVQLLLAQRKEAVPPGEGGPAAQEAIRFRPAASLAFPSSDVASAELVRTPYDPETGEEASERFLVTVNFLGLYGPSSPMPNHFTEDILWAGPEAAAARDFLDLFHHRLISFVWRSWVKYRYPLQFASEDPPGPDPFTQRVLCLAGWGTEGQTAALGMAYRPLLRIVGLFYAQPRTAVGLEGCLRDQFEGISIEVVSCLERSVWIPEDQKTRLGSVSRLGEDACLGESVRDQGSAFQVVIGPMPAEQYRRFLPGEEDFARVVRLTRLYASDFLDFNVRLKLQAGEVPALVLSPEARLPLGQMSWILPSKERAGETLLSTKRHDPIRAAASSS